MKRGIAAQFKNNIKTLIENGNLAEAKILLEDYKKIAENDIETYSIMGVIAMMEGDMDGAEKILTEGLILQPSDEDINFNIYHLIRMLEDKEKSLELFCKLNLYNVDKSIKLSDFDLNKREKNRKDLKVVQGTIEIANQMNLINKGLKNKGVDATTINYYPGYLQYESEYMLDINSFGDINMANIETKKLASKVIANNDIFHFHFGTSLTLDYSDLPLLQSMGKKVIMRYHGSDVRMYSKAVKLNPYIKVKNMDEIGIRKKLEFISKYVPDCLVDYELAEYVKDYHKNINYTRIVIDLDKYKYVPKINNKRLLIVHAPTHPEIKGTKYILEAVDELKDKYDFDFQLVQGMKHEEAIKIYEKADLAIDQLLGGNYGVFAAEMMAMGKPVICYISDFMKQNHPRELPIILANPNNIKKKLEYTLKNKDMLEEIGINSRKYVERYHDMNKIADDLIKVYKKL